MRDVAALAGVALKTVSRVMNDEPTVAPELAARVHEAAEKLGYRPNLLASSLRRGDGRTSTIGMLVEDVANPFHATMMRAAEDEARRRGVQVLIASIDEDPARERQVVRSLIDRNVDGLVIVPAGGDQSYLVAERRRGAQVVFVDRPPGLFAADAIVSDNRGGADRATTHLLDRGHTRVAFLGVSPAISTTGERRRGYDDALQRARIPADPAIAIDGLRTIEDGERVALELLARPDAPTALFSSQNLVTIGAVKALRALGLQHEVALVGFDDFQLSDALDPGITVITQDAAQLGRLAVERLFARLDGDTSPPETQVVATGLIARGSGEIAATALV